MVACGSSAPSAGFSDGGSGSGEAGSRDASAVDGADMVDGALPLPGEGGVISMVPCTTAGGDCRLVDACGPGVGVLGSTKYNCGGSRRVCCFMACGGKPETTECCNAAHTYAPRPLCQDDAFVCSPGFTSVPAGTCIGDSGADASSPADASGGG